VSTLFSIGLEVSLGLLALFISGTLSFIDKRRMIK